MTLNKNDRVRHPKFGPGTIIEVTEDNRVEVLFDNIGRKRLDLKYANLVIISCEEEERIVTDPQMAATIKA